MPVSRRAAVRSSPRVAVLIEASNAYGRGLLEGIHRHLREHEPWTILLPEHGRGMPPLEMLARWKGDGIIARIETPAIAAAIRRLRRGRPLAVVDMSAARLLSGVPYVETDDAAIARLAADHFIERDFRHLAFLGDDRFRWSDNRQEAFVAAARDRSVAVYEPRGRSRDSAKEGEAIEAWLESLPKPVGLFACYDIRAWQAVEACR
ncbi:MAG: substrate-binding domain-containing protein, partial [Planctomycetota bacterium]